MSTALGGLRDARGRVKRKLRVSLTDRCNLRCKYCLPHTPQWLPKASLLPDAELHRLLRLFVVHLGITELRLTGGEPLLRPQLPALLQDLARLRAGGLQRIALTTNATQLSGLAAPLAAAGLDDLNISIDAIDPSRFKAMTGGELAPVLDGIAAARAAGLPVKLNAVMLLGYNEDQVLPLATWARAQGLALRFIEYMPLDSARAWKREDVITEADILAVLAPHIDLQPQPATDDPARYYQAPDGWRLGIISTISRPFCKSCDRLRLDARGVLYTCLFSAEGRDLRTPLLAGASDTELLKLITDAVWQKPEGYAARPGPVERPITMHHLGG